MQSDRQERISERAYHIWVAEGRIHGRHEEHWHRAEREIAEEELRLAAAMDARAARSRAQPTGAKVAGVTAVGSKSRASDAPMPRRGRGVPEGPRSS